MNKKQNPTDRDLILQYRQGDATVLPLLVKRYHVILCEKAYWVVKDRDFAKDIAQDTWITIIDKLDTLNNVDRFKSWAFRIVYTKAIDALKERSKKEKSLFDLGKNEKTSESSDDRSERIQKELLLAIQRLPPDKQIIIRLFYTEAYTVNEISHLLNIPRGTVKSRLFKSREQLKLILKNSHHEE